MVNTNSSTKARRKTKLPQLIQKYYEELGALAHQHVMYEMGTRPAFHALLARAGREHGWTLIAEQEKKVNGKTIRPDGTFKDAMNLVRGYWEAKDWMVCRYAPYDQRDVHEYSKAGILPSDDRTRLEPREMPC